MGCILGHGQQSNVAESRVNRDDKAIAELKITRDKVRAYIKKLENCIDHCKSAIKTCIQNKQKDKALLALKKQKYLEKNLETARGEQLNLDQLISDVENAQIQKNIYESLKQGTEFLKCINQQLTVDDVEKLMEETAEAIEYQQQIGEALSQQAVVHDDNKLLEELDNLEVLELDIPSVPIQPLPKVKKEVPEEKYEENVSGEKNVIVI
ncbi:unnamed protein product [Blepharisma stoltei]|uniref:Vacuolar protein sorting 20 n=1 Tax=Blepharisma stoltei TaxID=1481888 RepID=A0AAU9K1H4_9CILI|nr:unnamed protein product [Blepharisma stoltei]